MTPTPFNEHHRLLALYGYNVLDTAQEPTFDRIVRVAARHFRVPIALVSLVDPNRQWFKAAVGLKAKETPREVSFCAHAILKQEVMQVPDARADSRFADNPLVTGETGIRFYAGAPLVTPQGFSLGTLCIIDRKPRARLTPDEEAMLTDLAAIVVDELELRRVSETYFASIAPGAGMMQQGLAQWRLKQQEIAGEAMFDLLAALSHEFRTPLNAILGFSETIGKEVFGPLDNPKYRTYAEHIFDSGDHLLGLVEGILDFCKLKRGEIVLHEESIDLHQLVQRCTNMFTEQARRSGVAVESALPNQMPWLRADRQQLTQMLINLIGNGVKYTKAGGSVRVTQELEDDGSFKLSVSDTGIGIAPEDIEKTLVPFGQIDNEQTRKHSGTGLGLPLTRRLIELHGGRLAMGSRPEEGTTVSLHFPSYRIEPQTSEMPGTIAQGGKSASKSIA